MGRLRIALLLWCLAPWPAQAAELVVFAASSLGSVMREIARAYEARSPQDQVLINLAASDALVALIDRGTPVDLLATADPASMDVAEQHQQIVPHTRVAFAGNQLVVAVPAARLAVSSLDDLTRPGVRRIALGDPAIVPAGRYAREALEAAGLWARLELKYLFAESARAALELVASGEADAGFVYATDIAAAAPRVKMTLEVPLPRPIHYEVAVAKASRDKDAARGFVTFMTGPAGRAVLSKHGFHIATQ